MADNILGDLSEEESRQYFKGIGKFKDLEAVDDIKDSLLTESVKRAKAESKIVNLMDGIIFPLLSGVGESAGALYLAGHDIGKETEIIKIYVNQAATAINNALLHNLVSLKNDELSHTYNLLKDRYMDTVEALRLVVDAKDVYTRGHSDRVSCIACRIGEARGLSEDEIEILRVGGLFHDVGKVGIPDKILLKTSELTGDEYEVVKQHPAKGTQILSGMSIFKDMLPLIIQHHERIDGKGYPRGLKGDEIDPLARIVAVADAFDAMQSDRTYRSRFTLDETIAQLERGKGTQFDGNVVDLFVKMLADEPQMCSDLVY